MKFFFCLLCTAVLGLSLYAQDKTRRINGVERTRYSNGKLQSRGKVINHLKSGEWNYWDEKGRLIRTENYLNNRNAGSPATVRQGRYTGFYSSGQIDSTGNYYNGKKTGEWKSYFSNGTMASVNHYDSLGLEIGIQQTWNRSGYPLRYCVMDTVRNEYDYEYYSNGLKKSVEHRVNWLLEGRQYYYNEDPAAQRSGDSLQAMSEYRNGGLNGTFIWYGKSGKKIQENHYVNNVQEGAELTWNPRTGFIFTERYYKHGIADSVARTYFENGSIAGECYFDHGTINGRQRDYFFTPYYLKKETWYRDGIMDSAYNYDRYGRISSKEFPLTEINIGKWNTCLAALIRHVVFDSLGRKKNEYVLTHPFEGSNVKKKKTGVETYFFPDGKVSATVTYVDEKNYGVFTGYDRNGKVILEGLLFEECILSRIRACDKNGKSIADTSPAFDRYVNANLPVGICYYSNTISESPVLSFPPDTTQLAPTRMPRFPGGSEGLKQFIRDNLHYPGCYRADSLRGTVVLEFVVAADGSIGSVFAAQTVADAPLFTNEALRLLWAMPGWIPVAVKGVPQNAQVTLPVEFSPE